MSDDHLKPRKIKPTTPSPEEIEAGVMSQLAREVVELGLLADFGEQMQPALGDSRAVRKGAVQVQKAPATLSLDFADQRGEFRMGGFVNQGNA